MTSRVLREVFSSGTQTADLLVITLQKDSRGLRDAVIRTFIHTAPFLRLSHIPRPYLVSSSQGTGAQHKSGEHKC